MSVTIDNHIDITVDLNPDQKRFYRWWVSALEAGEYKQATGTLRRSVDLGHHTSIGHCCLGVAAEGMRLDEFTTVRANLGLGIADTRSGGLVVRFGTEDEDLPLAEDDDLLPETFDGFLGFGAPLGLDSGRFAAANDTYCMDFKAIARAIRLALVGKDAEARAVLIGNENQPYVNESGNTYPPGEYDHDGGA